MAIPQFIHSTIDKHLGKFKLGIIANNVSWTLFTFVLCTYLHVPLRSMPRTRVAAL